MPSGDRPHIAPNMATVQFEFYLDKTARQPESTLAQPGYELIYRRPVADASNDLIAFAERASSWWTRRQDRKRTREELANLINESFGGNFASVERGWLFEESIGHRLVRDLAPQGWFSITKIDEAAFKEIARSINEIRREIESKGGLLKPDPYRDKKTTYILSPKNLTTIYKRAGAHPQGLGRPKPVDAFITERGGADELKDNRANNSAHDLLDEDIAVTVNQAQRPAEAALHADDGGAEFALSEAYRRGLQGHRRDWDEAAYYLVLAHQKGNEDAQDELDELAEKGDRRLQQAVYEVYREGRGEVEQNSPEAAFWLARSWQGLRAAHDHTAWVTAPRAGDAADAGDHEATIPPGAVELALVELFLNGHKLVEANPEKAAYFLLLAAQRGNEQARTRLTDLAAARGADGDDLALQLALHRVYRQGGEEVAQDPAEAVLWLARAMAEPDGQDDDAPRATLSWVEAHLSDDNENAYERQLNLAPVLFELSQLHRTGRDDIERNTDKAAFFLALAAEPSVMGAGHEDAMAALEELEKENADPAMQYALYELYRKGADGIEWDLKAARLWLMRAMGVRPYVSEDENTDGGEWRIPDGPSEPWAALPQAFKNAAAKTEKGDREFTLYEAYRDGSGGVERDMQTAFFWLLQAEIHGHSCDDPLYTNFTHKHQGARAALCAISLQDFKKYAEPLVDTTTFYSSDDVGPTCWFWQLTHAIRFADDGEAYYERAQCHKIPQKIRRTLYGINTVGHVIEWDRYAADLWRAAQHDVPKAQYELAQLYKGGENRTDTDDMDYAHWLIRAASGGHVGAGTELEALRAARPKGQSDRVAFDARLQYAVGQIYAQGLYDLGRSVIDPNLEEAKAFTQSAVDNGYGAAADSALTALNTNGLPPRPPLPDFKAPAPAGKPDNWSRCRFRLAIKIAEFRLLDKVMRDVAPFNCADEAVNQWLREHGIEIDSRKLIEAHAHVTAAMIAMLKNVADTGQVDATLKQNYRRCYEIYHKEFRKLTNIKSESAKTWSFGRNPLTEALRHDQKNRHARANNGPFDETQIMPDHIRRRLVEDAKRLEKKILEVSQIHHPTFGTIASKFSEVICDMTFLKEGPSYFCRTHEEDDLRDSGVWHIAAELDLVKRVASPSKYYARSRWYKY